VRCGRLVADPPDDPVVVEAAGEVAEEPQDDLGLAAAGSSSLVLAVAFVGSATIMSSSNCSEARAEEFRGAGFCPTFQMACLIGMVSCSVRVQPSRAITVLYRP